MDTNSVDWKEAREYSFQMLQLLINASESEEALKHLEHDIDALNNNYSSNVYLAGMQYTVEDIGIFRIGEDSERDKKLSELFNNISDLLKDNEESLIPPVEIFEPMKDGNIDDFKVSNDFNNTNETTNEGETMNTNTNKQEATKQENVKVLTKTSTWCKVVGGLAVTTAIAGGAYYAYKKFFKGSEE